jgi:hypothetical protein
MEKPDHMPSEAPVVEGSLYGFLGLDWGDLDFKDDFLRMKGNISNS